jgi:hypothetical protein
MILNPYEQPGIEYKANKILINIGAMKFINSWRVWNQPNTCFIWIPKTAGTSVFRWLHRQIGMRRYQRLDFIKGAFPNIGPVTFGHMSYVGLVNEGLVKQKYNQNAFKFAFVRNPYDRAVSLFYYLIRVNVLDKCMIFRDFLQEVYRGVEPIGLYNVKGLSQCNPQVDWICDKDNKIWVDYLADMETFSNHIDILSAKLGIQSEIHHENQTERVRELSELYADTECVALVKNIYRKDFEILGYDMNPNVFTRTQ